MITNEEKKKQIENCLKGQDVFKVRGVHDVNHKPHPFTIGTRHVVHASDNHSGMLGDETMKAIGCDVSGCGMSYEDHTSDNVAFLQVIRKATTIEANDVLKGLVDELGEDVVDGFTLVESEFKIEES
jgi:hypothetical protein